MSSTPGSSAALASASKIELADFIYRDNARINSLYAQLFNGLLVNSETTEAAKDAAERGLGITAVVTGAYKRSTEANRSVKETRQPHDTLAGDLLASLGALGRISDDVPKARAGQIVRAIGRLFLLDPIAVKAAMFGWLEQANGFDERARSAMLNTLNSISKEAELPNAFILETGAFSIAGTLSADGLSEPIIATMFKHGRFGIEDVGVVGIKEVSSYPAARNDGGAFSDRSAIYASGLYCSLFPGDAHRVAPLVIFRNVH